MASRRKFIKSNLLGLAGMALWPYSVAKPKIEDSTSFRFRSLQDQEQVNWREIRKAFPLTDQKAYFNTAGLGPTLAMAVDAVCERMKELAERSRDGRWLFDDVRAMMAEMVNSDPENLAFTRNTTEGINIAANNLVFEEGDEILLTNHEHVGGSSPWINLAKKKKLKVRLVDLDLNGEDNLDRIQSALSPKTKVFSFSHILCTNGLILPAKEIVKMCRECNVYTCVDGAQTVGMIEVDLKSIDPDFYAFSGHKWMFGPLGTGMVYIRDAILENNLPANAGAYTDSNFDLGSISLDYKETADREEYGTRNAALIAGLGEAIKFNQDLGIKLIRQRSEQLIQRFLNGVKENQSVLILSPTDPYKRSSIITFQLKQKDSRQAANWFRGEAQLKLRHVYEADLNAIRVSFAIFNQESEVDALLDAISDYSKNG